MVEKKLLLEQILTRIARDAQFRKHDDFDALAFCLGDETLDLLDIIFHIGHLHDRHASSHFDKSVFHIFTF